MHEQECSLCLPIFRIPLAVKQEFNAAFALSLVANCMLNVESCEGIWTAYLHLV
jgi:hypothetical protein